MSIVPHFGHDESQEENTFNRFKVIFCILSVVLLGCIFALWRFSVNDARKKSEISTKSDHIGSQLISFSQKDIEIDRNWNLFSGFHPAVSFKTKIAPPVKVKRVAFLYHFRGSEAWHTIDAKKTGDNAYSLTVRDLEKEANYECLFAVFSADTVLYSDIVNFSVGSAKR